MTGKPLTNDEMPELVGRYIIAASKWSDNTSMSILLSDGVILQVNALVGELFIELDLPPTPKTKSDLVKELYPDIETFDIKPGETNLEDIMGVITIDEHTEIDPEIKRAVSSALWGIPANKKHKDD